ncbi:protocadherin gamma-C3 isoform X5 [Phoca vitulina]|uniref:protocadherin gamma-C3 isoform X5 n=1 Tax=Phoca vitulina TaxID=9720 RepID=UPI001395FE84|nr:protocadherin gamma-C3 isoform X5 [Phoca vitulina]
MLSASHRDNKPIERNAVDWEEGEKIGGFLFLGFFFFLQCCDALTLLLLGCSLLSLLAEPRSCCLPIRWWKADKSTPPPANTARNPCGAGPAARQNGATKEREVSPAAVAVWGGSASSASQDQQAPPNTDWRFSQAQRPGTSGSQNGDETGTWPNNQFDTEMLQAMILASASEAADGSSTLGGGAGTMGLSARYGPQFTLQHVPDYRQNVYIPGSNATLTSAAGKRDGKAPAGGNGNKKKSGKKEKK